MSRMAKKRANPLFTSGLFDSIINTQAQAKRMRRNVSLRKRPGLMFAESGANRLSYTFRRLL